MFLHQDRDPGDDPVAHDGQEILEDAKEVVPARDGADQFNQRDEDAPDPARDGLGVASEDLNGQCSRICAGCVVGDAAEGKDDNTEATETAEAVVAFQEQGAG